MIQVARLAERIMSGTCGKLDFDFACQTGRSFDESWLHNTLVTITQAQYPSDEVKVEKNDAVTAIARVGAGSGRRREVDVVARRVGTRAPDDSGLVACIEAKWAVGTSNYGSAATNILTDIARLAMIAGDNPDVLCLFVLAGGKAHVEKAVTHCALPDSRGVYHRLLKEPGPGPGIRHNAYRLANVPGRSAQIAPATLETLKGAYPNVPDRLHTAAYRQASVGHPNWRVFVWRVLPPPCKSNAASTN